MLLLYYANFTNMITGKQYTVSKQNQRFLSSKLELKNRNNY